MLLLRLSWLDGCDNMKNFFIIMFLFLFSSCDSNKDYEINGYVEGEYVYISPAVSGILEEISVIQGKEIVVGQRLFAVDTVKLQAALKSAIAKYDNLRKGKRLEEIAVIEKQKDQAEANLINAKKAYDRCSELFKRNVINQSELDEKTAAYKSCTDFFGLMRAVRQLQFA